MVEGVRFDSPFKSVSKPSDNMEIKYITELILAHIKQTLESQVQPSLIFESCVKLKYKFISFSDFCTSYYLSSLWNSCYFSSFSINTSFPKKIICIR